MNVDGHEEIRLVVVPDNGLQQMSLNSLRDVVHANAVDHGWHDDIEYDDSRNVAVKLALVHAEVSEALEHLRDGQLSTFLHSDGKPDGFEIEIADAIIRLLDLCGAMGIDIASAVALKHEYNRTRPHRHGGKTI